MDPLANLDSALGLELGLGLIIPVFFSDAGLLSAGAVLLPEVWENESPRFLIEPVQGIPVCLQI
jgi:hypothetical protein